MYKKITSSVLAAIMIAGFTSFTAFAAMPSGTVAIGGKAFDLAYANDPANLYQISNALLSAGEVYVKGFDGIWINNNTGEVVEASVIPAVVYKSVDKQINFDAADKDQVNIISVNPFNTINVVYGTTVANANLPAKVTLKLSNNTTKEVDVTWTSSNYDETKTSSYIFNGDYALPEGVTGTKPDITVNVVVGVNPDLANIDAAETAVKVAETSRMNVDVTTATEIVGVVKDTTKKEEFNVRIANINVLDALVSKGDNTFTLTKYDVLLSDFISQEMLNTPAAAINGQWCYALIKNGQPGYFTDMKNPNGSWVNSLAVYNSIKDQLVKNVDPLNLENDSAKIYEFIVLNYVDCVTAAQLDSVFGSNGTLKGKGQVFIDAAKANNVNPIYLAAHAILETGYGTSLLANGGTKDSSGNYTNGIPVYNLFGIGAIDSDPDAFGTSTAFTNGWTSIDLAIYGGAAWISKGYIGNYQNTLYKMRWNPLNIYHQYATDVNWANSQIRIIKSCFDLFPDVTLTFDIPVFN
ncbi:MAG TPA: glucosaminidase domain-containing protein [Clostridium sp.]|uniref:N-acetylglucosaminidase n=1 Tax=Clostridium sp. TaxID=1506 RepID=UPI002F94397F